MKYVLIRLCNASFFLSPPGHSIPPPPQPIVFCIYIFLCIYSQWASVIRDFILFIFLVVVLFVYINQYSLISSFTFLKDRVTLNLHNMFKLIYYIQINSFLSIHWNKDFYKVLDIILSKGGPDFYSCGKFWKPLETPKSEGASFRSQVKHS